jgi:predicted phosphodiesterase
VLVASAAGGLVALWSWSQEKRLGSTGTVVLSVEPFHKGALDVYVPLVDWGVRFGGPRIPARLLVEVRTVDRGIASRVATGARPSIARVRAQAHGAIASYLRMLALVTALAALALGSLVALTMRRPRLIAAAAVVALAWMGVIALLLAPRSGLDAPPEFYAHGAEIPVALQAVETVGTSAERLSQTTDEQLVGLARIVQAPAGRRSLAGEPHLIVASDLHNNLVAIPTLARAARGVPVLFPGDLTDRGTPLEGAAVRRVVSTGRPFVFTAGNHDSDTLERELARAGAVVLDEHGRLRADGTHGPLVTRVAGLRVAGYASPNMRRAADGYRDRGADVTPAEQAAFQRWLSGIVDRVDVVLVHEPKLAAPAIAALRSRQRVAPLLFAVGHTHVQAVSVRDEVAEVNGGTIGAGGTGNLGEGQSLGLATVTFRRSPFALGSAGLVEVNPGSGASTARRVRLDGGPVELGDPNATSPEAK